MGKYKAGIVTKQKLINSAKELFYKNGYDKVNIKDICTHAEVLRTAFFYYFKDKPDIADFICNDTNQHSWTILDNYVNEHYNSQNGLIRASVSSALFFASIFNDKKILKFYSEVLRNNADSNVLIGNRTFKVTFEIYASYAPHQMTEAEFDMYFIYSTSAPGNLLYSYKKGYLKASSEDIIRYIIKRPLDILELSSEEKANLIEEAINSTKQFDLNLTKLFLQKYVE